MTETFTVFGYWADTNERYGQDVDAVSAHEAERRLLAEAEAEGGILRIAGTLLGEHQAADTYTAFIDPDDPENEAREGLQDAICELEVCEWTVLGLVTSTQRADAPWNLRTGGERYLGHEMALSARIAEDLARTAVRERGMFELTVCTVLAGRKNRCESYTFADHDQKPLR